ncbi:hypothetical protein COCMIDRAFT_97345 [Bipolaris oryzae ATCC 44560]|uniref:Uncharacterized protein n=1 Tax=Bipolaris oryzae ATCC 44560 TaxID=930090 RepID=W6ZBC8_COCMI|nr:uncharacterized protein COCMIDRAFT_97345 [Bipolaris oryzae ATCC 44560]EUC44749.1 hypothetical protein COCMIDRAFT_97345 [Bipolaris oryzae ATCC 44560]
MAHQIPLPQQTQYPGPIPQNHQNAGQQRHASNGQHQSFGQNSPRESEDFPSDPIQAPLLVSFILERPRNDISWEDVVPEQQHVRAHDLKKEVLKFRRNYNNVKKALDEISSPNCRRIINELVEEQNVALTKHNPTMEYRIVSLIKKFRERASLTRRERYLARVDIILEAEDSGLQATKTGFQGRVGNQSQNMSAPPQMPQQRPQPHGPHNVPPHPHPELSRSQPPPLHVVNPVNNHMPIPAPHVPPPLPPPPHLNGGMNGQTPVAGPPAPPPPPPPPPPPNGGVHPVMSGPRGHQPPIQPPLPQGLSGMPGTYPEAMPVPVPRHIPGRKPGPVNQTMDPELPGSQQTKHKSHMDASSLYSDSEVSWEDESENSSFVDIDNDMHGEMRPREPERGRHAKLSRNNPKHRMHSRSKRQSRSRSQSHLRRGIHQQNTRQLMRRHRTNSDIDEGYTGRRTPDIPSSSSPQPLRAKLSSQVPANIHIHMNTNNSGDERTRSGNASPTSLYSQKRVPGKMYNSHDDMSDASWDRASGTGSWHTSSVHTAEDNIWDVPSRSQTVRREHSQRKPTFAARPNDAFDTQCRSPNPNTADLRSAQRPRYPREPSNEHMPTRSSMRSPMREQERERDHEYPSYSDDQQLYHPRPDLPHRRTTPAPPRTQHNNSFTSPYPPTPPKLARASTLIPDVYDHAYTPAQPRRRQIEAVPRDEQINLRDLRDALEWARERNKEKETMQSARYGDNVSGRRRRRRRDSGMDYDDEWDFERRGGVY